MVNFDSICLWLNTSRFYGNFDIIFEFLSQKSHPGKFLKPEVILSRNYLRKFSVWLPAPPSPPIIINLPFLKNAINSEPLGIRV